MTTKYGSFGKRLVAYIVDSVIINIPIMILSYIVAAGMLDPTTGSIVIMALSFLLFFGYYAYFESSEKQATPGKSIMNLKVTDLNGNRISFGKSILRNFMKIVSAMILLIGFIMAAFTQKKQALHDMAAGALVLDVATAKELNTVV